MEQMKQCICKHVQKAHMGGTCLACEDCEGYTEEVDDVEVPIEVIGPNVEYTTQEFCEKCGKSLDDHMEMVRGLDGEHVRYFCPEDIKLDSVTLITEQPEHERVLCVKCGYSPEAHFPLKSPTGVFAGMNCPDPKTRVSE